MFARLERAEALSSTRHDGLNGRHQPRRWHCPRCWRQPLTRPRWLVTLPLVVPLLPTTKTAPRSCRMLPEVLPRLLADGVVRASFPARVFGICPPLHPLHAPLATMDPPILSLSRLRRRQNPPRGEGRPRRRSRYSCASATEVIPTLSTFGTGLRSSVPRPPTVWLHFVPWSSVPAGRSWI